MGSLVEASGLMKEYDGEVILSDCNVVVNPGDAIALIGASGEGKSTLLSLLGLLLTPSAGRLTVQGQDIATMSDSDMSQLRAASFGFMFQHTQLVGSLRARENVLVPACFSDIDKDTVASRADELMTRFGLDRRLHHFPHQLSVGQKRRVALARALVLSPTVLVADEPTNDLDDASARTVVDALLRYPDGMHAVIFATHDGELARAATRVLRIERGRVEEISSDEVKGVRQAC